MKKILIVLVAVVLLCSAVAAETLKNNGPIFRSTSSRLEPSQVKPHAFNIYLTSALANAIINGTSVDLGAHVGQYSCVARIVSAAATDTATVKLQASLDDSVFFGVHSTNLTNSVTSSFFNTSAQPARYWRGAVSAATLDNPTTAGVELTCVQQPGW